MGAARGILKKYYYKILKLTSTDAAITFTAFVASSAIILVDMEHVFDTYILYNFI